MDTEEEKCKMEYVVGESKAYIVCLDQRGRTHRS
jgi:hypothetical protein